MVEFDSARRAARPAARARDNSKTAGGWAAGGARGGRVTADGQTEEWVCGGRRGRTLPATPGAPARYLSRRPPWPPSLRLQTTWSARTAMVSPEWRAAGRARAPSRARPRRLPPARAPRRPDGRSPMHVGVCRGRRGWERGGGARQARAPRAAGGAPAFAARPPGAPPPLALRRVISCAPDRGRAGGAGSRLARRFPAVFLFEPRSRPPRPRPLDARVSDWPLTNWKSAGVITVLCELRGGRRGGARRGARAGGSAPRRRPRARDRARAPPRGRPTAAPRRGRGPQSREGGAAPTAATPRPCAPANARASRPSSPDVAGVLGGKRLMKDRKPYNVKVWGGGRERRAARRRTPPPTRPARAPPTPLRRPAPPQSFAMVHNAIMFALSLYMVVETCVQVGGGEGGSARARRRAHQKPLPAKPRRAFLPPPVLPQLWVEQVADSLGQPGRTPLPPLLRLWLPPRARRVDPLPVQSVRVHGHAHHDP